MDTFENPEISPDRRFVHDYLRPRYGPVRSAAKNKINKTEDSPIPRPVRRESPVLPTRQKTIPEKPTGGCLQRFETRKM